MNEEKLSITISKSLYAPNEYFEEQRKYAERDLAIKLWNRLPQDEWCTVKITRTSPYNFYLSEPQKFPSPIPDRFETSVYIGKVKPVHVQWKPSKKLTFKERLKVFFTGRISLEMAYE